MKSDGFGRMLVVICAEEDFDDFLLGVVQGGGKPCHVINIPKGCEHTTPRQDVREFMDEYVYARDDVYLHYVRTTAASDLDKKRRER